jgi:hypothetical protein
MIFSHVLYQLSYPAKQSGQPLGLVTETAYLEAGATGLEPATSDVTGRRSNQLSYTPANRLRDYLMSSVPCKRRFMSGRSRFRTCDPLLVRQVLSH